MRQKKIIDLYVYDEIILRIYSNPDDRMKYEEVKIHVMQDDIHISIQKGKK
jgi:hypothetical protein